MRMYSDRTRFFQSLIVRGPAGVCDASLPWSLWMDDSKDASAAGLDTVPVLELVPAATVPDTAALRPLRVVRSDSISSLCGILAVALALNTKTTTIPFLTSYNLDHYLYNYYAAVCN